MRYLSAILLLMLAMVATAVADERTQIQAERTIRRMIVNDAKYSRVFFHNVDQGFLSFTESKVTGRGTASRADGWGGMPFKFSIKVHRDDLRTRDAVVEFADGSKLDSNSSWRPPTQGNYHSVRITSPYWYQTMGANTFTMRGESEGRGSINLIVYDRQNRIVHRSSITPNIAGTWATNLRLADGTYRAVATRSNWNSGDEVRFNVRRGNGDWNDGGWSPTPPSGGWTPPGTGAGLNVMAPRNGMTVTGSPVRINGTGRSGSVGLQIYRGNQRVVNASVAIANNRWSFDARLSDGAHRLIVSQGAAQQIINFTVRNSGSGGGWNDRLAISSPRQGERVPGPTAYINGSAPRGSVDIEIFRGNQRVYRSSVAVRNGRWGVSTRLNDGTYRVEARNGGERRTITFTVRR